MRKRTENKKIRTTISLKKSVWEKGFKKAEALNRNFSNFVETLIQRDANQEAK